MAEKHVFERIRSCLSLDLRPKLKTTFLRELDETFRWSCTIKLKTTFLRELVETFRRRCTLKLKTTFLRDLDETFSACRWIYALS